MKRNMTFDGSISSSFELARGLTAKIKILTEVTNEFNGAASDLSISQFIPISGVPMILKAGSLWNDKNRSKYFYGVYESEARDLREQYDPGTVFMPYFALSSFYTLTSKTNLFATINATVLPDKIARSPIVEKDLSINVVVGMGYSF
jgi:outer membrane protein